MAEVDSKSGSGMVSGDDRSSSVGSDDLAMGRGMSRRDFIKYSTGTVTGLYLGTILTGCGSNHASAAGGVARYPIDSNVVTTAERVLVFPLPGQPVQGLPAVPNTPSAPGSGTGLYKTELCQVSQFAKYGYGQWQLSNSPLPIELRTDLMPSGYGNQTPTRLLQFASFFTISDIHIIDKEAPNQSIYIQQEDAANGGTATGVYAPQMAYTTHILDAAVQTINALHKKTPFDFGISLGDTCNSTQYNELRWYIDVIDGKVITPSSGAHLGADTVDFQRPFQAAGLDKSIPWYQAVGNHDRFWLGSVPVDADPSLGIRESYVSGNVWAIGDILTLPALPTLAQTFPCVYDTTAGIQAKTFYMGVIDGASRDGDIIRTGAVSAVSPPPTVAADPNRRSLTQQQWIKEFFNTSTSPAGHGFNLVDPSMGSGFACYSFVPKSDIPLKIIVLDDVQSTDDGSRDIHGHGFLDETRWNWLQAELAAGQADNQLMIIAAHVPIAVDSIGSEMEWWELAKDPHATKRNAVTLTELVSTLQNTPNLVMWLAGHRHVNAVKAFLPPAGGNPENGFWQVETSSFHDFPQQFRTFQIHLNSDYTLSIVTLNVDPAVAEGTPAATSREYAIAALQIVQGNPTPNTPNVAMAYGALPVDTMDPTRPQDGSTDPTIKYGAVAGIPYCPSYNAELLVQLSPDMVAALKSQFPTL